LLLSALILGCGNNAKDEEAKKNEHLQLLNTRKTLPMDQYVIWVRNTENDLSKIKEISDINYRLSYMPKEYMTYLELKNEKYTKEQFQKVEKNYSDMSYFNFRIELKEGQGELLKYNLSSAQQYNDRITYMSFEMQKDIILVQNHDTIYPGLFHFERIFEVAPYTTVMFAFDNKKFNPQNEFTVVYNDRLFKKGYIKYNYKPKQLIDLPNTPGV
jgi:hypothetical protein